MKIMVTGGAGYIGSHTTKLLIEAGHEVTVFDNLSTGFRESIPPGVTFVFGDVRDTALLTRVLKDRQIEGVVHFAAKLVVSDSVKDPLDYYDQNVLGGLRLIEACEKLAVKTFVLSSTAAVYGETSSEPVKEFAPLNPINPYGVSKMIVEQALQNSSLHWVSLRYFNVAGAAEDGTNGQLTKNATNLIKVAAEAACGIRPHLAIFGTDYATADGTALRDYIHIEDLAAAHVLALNAVHRGEHGGAVNVGYGHGSSVRDVVNMMKKVSGVDFPVIEASRREADPVSVIADSSRLRDEWGWKPRLDSLEKICASAYAWERKQVGK